MKFRVEAYIGAMGSKRYRLQQDENWRQIGSVLTRNGEGFDPKDDLQPTDKLFDILEETRSYVCKKGEIWFGDKMYRANPTSGTLAQGLHDVYIHAKVNRQTRPRTFSIDELTRVIALGDDTIINALVLDLEGKFNFLSQKSPHFSAQR